MNRCVGSKGRAKGFRRWLRIKLGCAGGNQTHYWLTRLERMEDMHYHEQRTEIDVLRQRVALLEQD